MALPGPAQDPNKVGRTPNAAWTDVPDVPFEAGRLRDLPARLIPEVDDDGKHLLTEGGWLAQTETWWDVVRTMPHAALWTEADWLFAMDTAVIKDTFYSGAAKAGEMTEMRRREDLMALSSEARRKARIRYVTPPPPVTDEATPGNVLPIGRASRRIIED